MLRALSHVQSDPPVGRLHVIVTAARPSGVIEFTFVYGDPDLAVELVLPLSAFREFVVENGCLVSTTDTSLQSALALSLRSIGITPTLQPGIRSENDEH